MRTFASKRQKAEPKSANLFARGRNTEENAAVSNIASTSALPIHRKASCACGGGCPDCQAKSSDPRISHPSDPAEIEADRIADHVMRMPADGPINANSFRSIDPHKLHAKCDECEDEDALSPENDEPSVMRASADTAQAVQNVLPAGGGEPLSAAALNFYEPRFGFDFSGVRIHSDARAHEAARSINAEAFTFGQSVVFGEGQYAPESRDGQRLLAHELTHVVQQNGGITDNQLKIQKRTAGTLQRQQATCAIDFIQLAKLAAGDNGAALEVLNCCASGLGPLPSGCTADVVAAAKKILGRGGKKGPQKADCRGLQGFRPGTSKEFIGQCCRGEEKEEFPGQKVVTGIESKENCCPPEHIGANDVFPRCCTNDEIVLDGHCVRKPAAKIPSCPPGQSRTIFGTCVQNKQPPPVTPEKPPVRPPPPFTTLNTIVIKFNKDTPQSWHGFKASATADGQTHFDQLVAILMAQPEAKIRLEAHASSDRPKGDEDYNKRLTNRRVKMIADELKKKKIDAGRVSNPPDRTNPPDCEEIATGQLSCGDSGSSTPVDSADRKVVALIFIVTP